MITFSKLKPSHALITGAGKGIGRAIAIEISQHVSKLTLIGRNSNNLREVQSLLQKNCEVQFFECDVTKELSVQGTFTKAAALFGQQCRTSAQRLFSKDHPARS